MYNLHFSLIIFIYQGVYIVANIYNYTAIDLSTCKVHYSRSGTVYRDFYSITNTHNANDTFLLDFHFTVLAPSDAHILLAPSDKVTKADPVYEIVIGAGGNTFCDIRRRQKSDVRASVRKAGLLNALDPQSFWIHFTKDGDISVGKESEVLPFISWVDPDPLPLKVISFSTWSGIEAKWYFDCKMKNETKEIEKPLTDLERLRRDLLYHYDPYVRPVKNVSTATNISMALKIDYIMLNEHRGTMEVTGAAAMMWDDQKLLWDPKQYGGIKTLHIFRREIWQPDLVLYNAIGDVRDLLEDALMVAHYTGYVEWNPKIKLKVFCDSNDLGTWPKDTHNCNVILGFMREFNHMKLYYRRNESKLSFEDSSEWSVLKAEVLSGLTFNEKNETSEPAIFEIIFTLKRSSKIYEWLFSTPFIIISVTILLSFWMDPLGNLKISVSCGQMILCTIMLLSLGKIAPNNAKKVPFLILLYSYTLTATVIAMIIAIIVINLARNIHRKSVPHLLGTILTSQFVKYCLCLPSIKLPDEYGNLDDNPEKIQTMWILLGVTIDRITFFIYLGLTVYALFLNYYE